MFHCSRQKEDPQVFMVDEDTGIDNMKKLSEAEQVALLQRRLADLEKRSAGIIHFCDVTSADFFSKQFKFTMSLI